MLTPVVEALGQGMLEVLDLTHPLSPESLYWPTGFPFEHERLEWGRDEAGRWYAAGRFSSPEHLGTHLDAPIHFAEAGWTSTDIPIHRLVGPGVILDISGRAADDRDAVVEPDDILAWEAAHGPLAAGAIVLVRTGWSSHWPDWNAYYGSETPMDATTLHFPGLSPDAATFFAERRVAGVGIDTASIDPGVSTTFDAHRALAEANVYGLENLTGLERLPSTGFLLVALPIRIEGGSGGPVRVAAFVEPALD